eukprot:3619059-Prymnesium_polylepis.1
MRWGRSRRGGPFGDGCAGGSAGGETAQRRMNGPARGGRPGQRAYRLGNLHLHRMLRLLHRHRHGALRAQARRDRHDDDRAGEDDD